MFNKLAYMWCLLSRVPLPQGLYPKEPLGATSCLVYAAPAGFLLGALNLLFLYALTSLLPSTPAAWILTFLYALSGWTLHLDGWGDLFDGIGSGRSGEEMRAVMKDSRCGSFSVIALFCALGIRSALLDSIPTALWGAGILLSASVGRLAICSAAHIGKYPWTQGMGKDSVLEFHVRDLFYSLFFPLFLTPLFGVAVIYATFSSLFIGYALGYWTNIRLGGVNGDVLGSAAVLGELTTLAIYTNQILQQ